MPDSWRPLQDPLIILAPEPSVEDNAFSASERLRAVEARLTQRLSASSTTLPANWATAVTSLRASGLPAIQFATDDLTDALMAFRARRGPPSGVSAVKEGGLAREVARDFIRPVSLIAHMHGVPYGHSDRKILCRH